MGVGTQWVLNTERACAGVCGEDTGRLAGVWGERVGRARGAGVCGRRVAGVWWACGGRVWVAGVWRVRVWRTWRVSCSGALRDGRLDDCKARALLRFRHDCTAALLLTPPLTHPKTRQRIVHN